MKTFKLIVATILFSSIALTSCNKETDEVNDSEPKTMTVRMTDAPGDYAKLEVEILEIEAYNESKGWIMLENETQIVSVLELTNGNEIDIVSETKVKSGTYTKLRLTFGDNNKVWVNTEATLGGDFITAEFNLAMNLPNKQYEVTIDQNIDGKTGANILLDFDVANSISGDIMSSFSLNPQITYIKDENTGIRGSIEGSENTAIIVEGNGETYSTYADNNGEFLIRGMVEGSYDVMLKPTEDDLEQTTTFEAVVVTEGEIKSMGTLVINE